MAFVKSILKRFVGMQMETPARGILEDTRAKKIAWTKGHCYSREDTGVLTTCWHSTRGEEFMWKHPKPGAEAIVMERFYLKHQGLEFRAMVAAEGRDLLGLIQGQ